MSHFHKDSCTCHNGSVASQSLEELDFERGIWSAAQYGELERVKHLVETGKCSIDQRDSAGYTALHYASRNGQLSVCKYLVLNGAELNATTKSGRATALHRAASAGHKEVIDYLLSINANVELQDSDGKTVLHRAAEQGRKDVCEILLRKFPQLKDIRDNKGLVADF
ncbi:hypothetical protein ABEB36_013279 [Hypothenemus hampei]|uniref:Ankyrin repeat domain-containing protein 39 n=1 Tax=Hypothenemus hampei TaxID=57062 RepID=A0ABD1E7G3_HYPHA